ncbi:MAG: hypothetical protein AAF558_02930 [Verrucomicrobiota bacterium]
MTQASNFTYWFARVAMGVAGCLITSGAVFANYLQPNTFEGWPLSRIITLLVGVNLMLICGFLFFRPLQVWLMRSFALRGMSPWSVILLSLSQATLACAGISICVVVIAADWINIDPTPGFGKVRALQLAAGLTLLLATYLLHSKPLQRLFIELIGNYYLSHLQLVILGIARWLLLIVGLVTVTLITLADVLKIDSTPGWGADRTIQLFVGLSMIAVSLILQNRAMKAWFLRSFGYRMLSPMQITVMLIIRAILIVAGATLTFLVMFADVLRIDRTPGWGEDRFVQLVAGIGLLLAGFVLHKRPLWHWKNRSTKS